LKRFVTVGLTVLILGSIVAAVAQAEVQKTVRRSGGERSAVLTAQHKAGKAKVATVKVSQTGAGAVLTNSTGHVLFMFAKDKPNKDSCKPIKNCETDWPPLTTTGKPKAIKGAKQSLLGTIAYKGKLREVTYDHHPLHTYKFDDGAKASFMFIGIKQFGAAWYGLTAAGKAVKTPSG
jgi:predicted lipoprotein with Yx(FWY)xxD motif